MDKTANAMKWKAICLLTFLMTMACGLSAKTTQKTKAGGVEVPRCPAKGELICHTGFALSYNRDTNCANWVAWELTREEARSKEVERVKEFNADPSVPKANRVEWYDYRQSGFDRGHMCPAGDMRWSMNAMMDCFFMSNICPQAKELNQKWWEHVERACRRWAGKEGSVYICCGPIYDKKSKARYIGKDTKVRVPDGFFKVVLSLQKGKEKAIGFVYRNNNERQTMEDAAMSVDEVEKLTGYDFFPTVEKGLQDRLEATYDLRKWN